MVHFTSNHPNMLFLRNYSTDFDTFHYFNLYISNGFFNKKANYPSKMSDGSNYRMMHHHRYRAIQDMLNVVNTCQKFYSSYFLMNTPFSMISNNWRLSSVCCILKSVKRYTYNKYVTILFK